MSRAGLFMFAEGERVDLIGSRTCVRGRVVGVEEREGGKRWYTVRWPWMEDPLYYHEAELTSAEEAAP